MKIELKRKIDGKWRYVDIHEYHGVPMLTILCMEMSRNDGCIRVTGDGGKITIITNDMLHHTHYVNRNYTVLDMKTGVGLIQKHYGDQLLQIVPEYVEQVFPGAMFVGVDTYEQPET